MGYVLWGLLYEVIGLIAAYVGASIVVYKAETKNFDGRLPETEVKFDDIDKRVNKLKSETIDKQNTFMTILVVLEYMVIWPIKLPIAIIAVYWELTK